MKKDCSQFENPLFIPQPRPIKSVKKLFIISFIFLSFSFFGFKFYYQLLTKYEFSTYFEIFSFRNIIAQKKKFHKKHIQKFNSKDQKQESHTLPLLVSLKGNDGPRLARVFVSIYLDSQDLKKPFGKEFENLENQLLFLLSGQSITHLNNKDFQDQIQNQLNLFLSPQMIQNLNIETELLNQTRSSL